MATCEQLWTSSVDFQPFSDECTTNAVAVLVLWSIYLTMFFVATVRHASGIWLILHDPPATRFRLPLNQCVLSYSLAACTGVVLCARKIALLGSDHESRSGIGSDPTLTVSFFIVWLGAYLGMVIAQQIVKDAGLPPKLAHDAMLRKLIRWTGVVIRVQKACWPPLCLALMIATLCVARVHQDNLSALQDALHVIVLVHYCAFFTTYSVSTTLQRVFVPRAIRLLRETLAFQAQSSIGATPPAVASAELKAQPSSRFGFAAQVQSSSPPTADRALNEAQPAAQTTPTAQPPQSPSAAAAVTRAAQQQSPAAAARASTAKAGEPGMVALLARFVSLRRMSLVNGAVIQLTVALVIVLKAAQVTSAMAYLYPLSLTGMAVACNASTGIFRRQRAIAAAAAAAAAAQGKPAAAALDSPKNAYARGKSFRQSAQSVDSKPSRDAAAGGSPASAVGTNAQRGSANNGIG